MQEYQSNKQTKNRPQKTISTKSISPQKMKNVLNTNDRIAFRSWLEMNHNIESECWVAVKRGKPDNSQHLFYIDAVEEALCFGWIDSRQINTGDSTLQRFSPRRKNSPWTELNKERVRRLERLGLMTKSGRAVLPKMGPRSFKIPDEIECALKSARAWSNFKRFPPLYQRVRAYNVQFTIKQNKEDGTRALNRLVEMTKKGKMYGTWDDYGRLS